jgi:hypothetical protein
MKLATHSFLIFLMSASLANFAFAGGEALSFKSGSFDAKHFSSPSQASLELRGDQMAHLTITGGTKDIQRTSLDQTFPFVTARRDSCNVRFYESGTLPARRAFQKYSANGLLMANIEIRDSRLSTCPKKSAGGETQSGIEITLHTKSATSVGTSTLQFDAIQTDLALNNSSRRMRAPALIIKGESTLVDLTSL